MTDLIPFGCIAPAHLMSDKVKELLDAVFDKGLPVGGVHYYEEGQEVEFDFMPVKTTAKVMKFSWISSSFELAGRTDITDIARDFCMMKLSLSRRIADYIDERVVKFGESCEAMLFSCPIRPERGRLYKGNGVYYASELDHQHWNFDFRVDLFLTPVIYTRDWKKRKKVKDDEQGDV